MKTAEELEMTFIELGALLGTRELLRSGVLKHLSADMRTTSARMFNMNCAASGNDTCGTVSCIGGTMGMLMGKGMEGAQLYVLNVRNPKLLELFYPPSRLFGQKLKSYRDITPEQAIVAIDNFLNTGRPQWADILEVI